MKMRRCDNRPPLLEGPFAQTLSGKTRSHRHRSKRKRIADNWDRKQASLVRVRLILVQSGAGIVKDAARAKRLAQTIYRVQNIQPNLHLLPWLEPSSTAGIKNDLETVWQHICAHEEPLSIACFENWKPAVQCIACQGVPHGATQLLFLLCLSYACRLGEHQAPSQS